MAIQQMLLDPNAQAYTDDEIVDKVNAATTDITRLQSVAGTALVDASVTASQISATAAIAGSQLAAGANIAGTQLAAAANIAGTQLAAAAAIAGTQLASTAAKDNLDALADTARGYIQTDPAAGQYPVIAIQRDSAGKLEADYDDVAI